MPMNIAAFAGAEKVKVNKGFDKKSFPKIGDYLYRLDTFRCKQNRKKIDVMVAEFTCVHIFSTEDGLPSHKVAEEVTKVTPQSNDYYTQDIKAIITSATGCSDEEIGQEEIVQAFGYQMDGSELEGGSPLEGQYITIRVSTVQLEKKDKPGEYFNITNFKEAFTPEQLIETLSDEVQKKFYTDFEGNNVNVLEEMASQ